MMTQSASFFIGLSIDPADPDRDVSVSDFLRTLDDLRAFLVELEELVSGERGRIRWEWDSDPDIRLRAEVNGVSATTLSAVLESAEVGVAAMKADFPTLAPVLPEGARRRLTAIVNRLTRFASITFTATGRDPIVFDPEQRELRPNTPRIHTEYSAIDGELDVINVHGAPHFVIFEHGTGQRVRCVLPDNLLPQVKEALKSRVTVEGLVRYREDGTPISIREITAFEIVPEPDYDILELEGRLPNLTGDLPSGEFIRQLREHDA